MASSSSTIKTTSSLLKRTALFSFHNELNARMIEFCGYSMPLQYGLEGIVESCLHTRASASLFDTSHMGQLRYEMQRHGRQRFASSFDREWFTFFRATTLRLYGKDRASFLERLTVGDIKGEKTVYPLTIDLFVRYRDGSCRGSFDAVHKR